MTLGSEVGCGVQISSARVIATCDEGFNEFYNTRLITSGKIIIKYEF